MENIELTVIRFAHVNGPPDPSVDGEQGAQFIRHHRIQELQASIAIMCERSCVHRYL